METHSKNTGFGGLSRRRCLAFWNSAAWRASKGGKSENSIAWEAVTAGKGENSLAWEAPTGGKSENSLAWGAPTGGKSENSLAWGAPTGGKSENSLAWGAPTGGKSENSLAWGAATGGKSENSVAWGAPTGGKVKILSLGSPHGGKPPLAPLTNGNKPAVWAATPREAGWIPWNPGRKVTHDLPSWKIPIGSDDMLQEMARQQSVFLQSDYIHQEVEIYGEFSADMRKFLAEILDLKTNQVI